VSSSFFSFDNMFFATLKHVQAHVAGEVKATLISPFAGRITDYFKVAFLSLATLFFLTCSTLDQRGQER
jgi:hypothetical protein